MKLIKTYLKILKDKFNRNKFIKNVAILTGGAFVAQLIAIFASPLLTRLYTPEDFGVLAVFIALLASLGAAASLKYHLAIPLADNEIDAFHILILSIVVNVFYGIIVSVILFYTSHILLRYDNLAVVAQYLWILPISIIALGVYESLKFWAIRQGNFNQIAKTKITQNLSMVGFQIGLNSFGPIGLVLGDAIGRSSGSGALGILAWGKIKYYYKELSLKNLKNMAYRFKRFPIFSSGSGVLNSLGLQLNPLLIAGILGPAVAGLYTLTEKVAGMPMKMIGQSYSQVYFKEAAEIVSEGNYGLNKLFNKQAKILFLIGLFPVTIFILLGTKGFEFIFGSEWRDSGLYVQILAPMLLVQFIVVPLSQTLNIIERQDIQLYWDVSRFLSHQKIVPTILG